MTRPVFNILITSISKKIPLIKSVQHAFNRLELPGNVIGADSNPQCIGRYFVDEFWNIPSLDKLTVDLILKYCSENKIQAIIPTRNEELPFFAKQRLILQEHGISCMVSSPKAIDLCLDKLFFSEFLNAHSFPAIKSAIELDHHNKSWVVKERFGSGSKQIGLNLTAPEAKQFAQSLQQPIFQPFIEGQEYSIDLYIDKTGSTVGSIARTRDCIVNGESQVTTSLHAPKLETVCASISEKLGLYGHIIYQILLDNNQKMHIIECNPRFGGASTLSVAMGLNSFEWFLLETLQRPLPLFVRAEKEKRQIRFPDDLIIDA